MDTSKKLIALVTGGTGGLGTTMCKKLAQDDYRVIVNYRSPEKAKAWQSLMAQEGYEFDMYETDIRDHQSVGRMIEQVQKEIGTIDILINNAAVTRDGQFREMTPEQWRDVIDTILTGAFNCTRHVINPMIAQNFGRIINISSVNGQRAQFGQTNYAAAKAGLHGFTKTLAVEVARKGVTVNTISPGYIATDMVMAVPEEVRERIVQQIPVGRLGGTEEVAYLVSYLASRQSAFITGANYAINGGQHVY